MREAAFCNCSAVDYININKDVQTEPDTMDNVLVRNFRKSKNEREEEEKEEEEENDVLEEEKCNVKAYKDVVKSLKELQEFAVQRNDSDMFVESQAAKRVNCVRKTLLDHWKK